MNKRSQTFYDPSNGLAELVAGTVFCLSFFCLLFGAADQTLNEYFHTKAYENAGWMTKISLNVFGPADYTQHLRGYEFAKFSFMAAIVSYVAAFISGLLTITVAWFVVQLRKIGPYQLVITNDQNGTQGLTFEMPER